MMSPAQRNTGFLVLYLLSPLELSLANSVIINEIMIDPKFESQPYGEWFELYNNDTVNDVDLTGWSFSSTSSAENVTILSSGGDANASYIIAAGGYLVLGNNAETVADVELNNFTLDYIYGSSAVAFYDAGSLFLYDVNGTLHNTVSWNSTDAFAIPSGASVALIESNNGSSINDRVDAHWCASVTPYGAGDMGTPGRANDCDASAPLSPNNISTPMTTTMPTMAPMSDNSGNPPAVSATAPTNAPVAASSDTSSSSTLVRLSASMISVSMLALAVIL